MVPKKKQHKSPSPTIRAFCHYCVQSRKDSEVEKCTGHFVFATKKPCPFFEYRTGGKRASVKLMRKFCLECMGGSREAVEECPTTDCLIYPYRLGKNPARAGIGKSTVQMASLISGRKALSRENLIYFKRTDSKQGNI